LASERRIQAELARLHDVPLNFDPARLPSVAQDPWHVDDYSRALRVEPPGEPVPGGPFEVATRLLRDYEFADPTRLRAHYRADAPLEGRVMLLEIRYLLVRVWIGVRIGPIFDEVRETPDGPIRVWGWAYQTLEGHLERGQMDYQVWKWVDTGEVEFRIHAVSQLARIRDPLLNVGFRLVRRREQTRFARRSAARMEELVRHRVLGGEPQPTPVGTAEVTISPVSRHATAGRRR
jgi:uncharacterized protein (UPF0548 family)